MALIIHALPTKWSQKRIIFPTNQTYLFISCFKNILIPAATINTGEKNRARNLNLGWPNTCESKSVLFIDHYTRVSKLNMSRANRDLNGQFKKCLNEPCTDHESCAPLQTSELLSAIKKMKWKVAAFPESISPSFLRSLGPLALQELLSIFNSSFSLGYCLPIWRVSRIIPLLKAGKFPTEVAPFYPTCLTWRVVKRLERILAHRINVS